MGPRTARSTSSTPLEEAAAITFRQKALLPLDDCLHALQREIPAFTRSSLHRLFQRHGISQWPKKIDEPGRKKKSFKLYPTGYLHTDIRELRTGGGEAYLSVAVDRTSKFVHAQLYQKVNRQVAADFLEATLQTLPYRAHTVLTDNGVLFCSPKRPARKLTSRMSSMWCVIATVSNIV